MCLLIDYALKMKVVYISDLLFAAIAVLPSAFPVRINKLFKIIPHGHHEVRIPKRT